MKNIIKQILKEEARKRRKGGSQNASMKKSFRELLVKNWTDTIIAIFEEYYGITGSYLKLYDLISEVVENVSTKGNVDFNDYIGLETDYHKIDADYRYTNNWWAELAQQLRVKTERNGNPTYEFIEDIISLMNESVQWLDEILDEISDELSPERELRYASAYGSKVYDWDYKQPEMSFEKIGNWVYDVQKGWQEI